MSEWFIENRVIKEKTNCDFTGFDYLSPKPKTLDDDAEKRFKGYVVSLQEICLKTNLNFISLENGFLMFSLYGD